MDPIQKYATRWRDVVHAPKDFKRQIRSSIRHGTISTLAHFKQPATAGSLRLVYCHYVFDDQVESFDRVIRSLKNVGKFVSTDTCMEMLNGTREIDDSYLHLSFDDGFKNVCTNALPILKEHQVPAIFFVPSALVSSDFQKTRDYCLDITHHKAAVELVTWDDLREFVAAGYEIGSHTRTHARFSEISNSKSRLEDEIAGSKRELEDGLGSEIKYISWPYGRSTDADAVSLGMAESAGYTACFGAFRGQVIKGVTNRFALPRHHFEVQWPLSHIRYFALGGNEKE